MVPGMAAYALFGFLMEATAPDRSDQYAAGRYGLIVIVREHSTDAAKAVARDVISRAGWRFPEVKEIMQIDGSLKLSTMKRYGLEEPIRNAAKQGHSIVVFDKV
jgi:hypothetical protein